MADDELIGALRSFFAARGPSIVCAYLYGSVARGQARAGSDVDIGVLFRDPPPATLDGLAFDLAGEIERVIGRPVDLIVLNRAPPDLVHRVLRGGVLLAESDCPARVAFETRKRAEYFDVLPYLRQYRRPFERRSA